MHPEKETVHILRRLATMWGYYCDGWAFSVTWHRDVGEMGAWTLRAAKGDVDVTHTLEREDWAEHYHSAVDEAAESMYLATFATRT